MQVEAKERRRHLREGLFAEIEDVTYRVLRRTELGEEAGGELAEFTEELADVNVTLGLPRSEQLGEPF